MEKFAECFSQVPDPRGANAVHDLREVLFIALLASLCGATSCVDMALFARTKERLLRSALMLKSGVPSHDTFSRIFRLIDPAAFEAAFRRFMKAFADGLNLGRTRGVVAVDGKALKRAYERGKAHMPPMMVTAWGAKTRMALANVMAEQGGEAAAVLKMIEFLQIKGCIVTADALHCRRDTAEAILARKADYVLAVKDNQPTLLAAAKASLAAARRRRGKRSAPREERAHGRRETRSAIVSRVAKAETPDFPGLKAFAMIKCRRGKEKPQERYFLLSRYHPPAQLLDIVREHWGIENRLHWTLDVVLDEDGARNRKDNAPANLAILRRLALNVARGHPDAKTSMRGKLKRAGWDETFMFELLAHMR